MSRLGKSELVYPALELVDHILAEIEAVTHDDVKSVAAEVLGQPKALAVVGPFDDPGQFEAALPG
jgi:predicted Zn-dependent peptidase